MASLAPLLLVCGIALAALLLVALMPAERRGRAFERPTRNWGAWRKAVGGWRAEHEADLAARAKAARRWRDDATGYF